MYFIWTWDMGNEKLDGPYDEAEHAINKLNDMRDEYLENAIVIGPLPVVHTSFGWSPRK